MPPTISFSTFSICPVVRPRKHSPISPDSRPGASPSRSTGSNGGLHHPRAEPRGPAQHHCPRRAREDPRDPGALSGDQYGGRPDLRVVQRGETAHDPRILHPGECHAAEGESAGGYGGPKHPAQPLCTCLCCAKILDAVEKLQSKAACGRDSVAASALHGAVRDDGASGRAGAIFMRFSPRLPCSARSSFA
jgi:hypothetical protein